MKLGIISDIHGNVEALKVVLEYFETHKVDKFVVLGDIAVKGPNPNEVVTILKELNYIAFIKGNVEEWLFDSNNLDAENKAYVDFALEKLTPENIEFLKHLPKQEAFLYNDKSFFVTHGDDNAYLSIESGIYPQIDEDYLLLGHTHCFMVEKFLGTDIINPGSVGLPLDGIPKTSFVLLDCSGKEKIKIVRLAYDIDKVIQDAVDKAMPYINKYESVLRKGRL